MCRAAAAADQQVVPTPTTDLGRRHCCQPPAAAVPFSSFFPFQISSSQIRLRIHFPQFPFFSEWHPPLSMVPSRRPSSSPPPLPVPKQYSSFIVFQKV
jgi:hypothetical protein